MQNDSQPKLGINRYLVDDRLNFRFGLGLDRRR